nr:recombinase family protein [Ktedonosporobacter rubrisoli]
MTKRVLRAVIYCRVSTDKQEQDGESLEYQEEKCLQYAALHGIEVILVLKETKSGYIHYSLREKLTVARQMLRDGLADMIIVWDLRRFSRNFVHSAMIFEEIESHGGEIVSVSENIDNSLTGRLIRSILAWSAESEREKIVEYANRHWKGRFEQGLPIGTGRAPYGWDWKDEDKTAYIINKEETGVRLSIAEMFLEEDMSLRAIAHHLTEAGITTPTKLRGVNKKESFWRASTVYMFLADPVNIGVITIARSVTVTGPDGRSKRIANENAKVVPGGIPAIMTVERYELILAKLATNQATKSHLHKNEEDFLLKGHIFCKTCNYSMVGKNCKSQNTSYPFYLCHKISNKYDACPDMPEIRTDKVNQLVWEDCCRVFERLELIREVIEQNIDASVQALLEDTKGRSLMKELEDDISYALTERDKHPRNSYYYTLIDQDVMHKQEQLARHQKEYAASRDVLKLSATYRESILGFLSFLSTMRGRYHEASFSEKRHALDVLGVQVFICPDKEPVIAPVETDVEWLTVREAARLAGIKRGTLRRHVESGNIRSERRNIPQLAIHRDELKRFFSSMGWERDLKGYDDEWMTVNQLTVRNITNWHTIHRALDRGTLQAGEREVMHTCIHRDELNRFLRESPVRPRPTLEEIQGRIEVTYSPMFVSQEKMRESMVVQNGAGVQAF